MQAESGNPHWMFWVMNPIDKFRPQLQAHAGKIVRSGILVALLLLAAGLTWRLVDTVIPHPVPPVRDLTPANAAHPRANPAALAARVENAHLFGGSPASIAPLPAVAADGTVTVMGIAYAGDGKDSVALLSVAGAPVVSQVGTPLATGETVSRILADRIELTGGTGTTTVLLDIKQADPNQRINPGSYASIEPADPSGPGALTALPESYSAPAARLTLDPTHFVSLQSLRGRGAMRRFEKIPIPRTVADRH